jgi:predicted AAA+ superfamily ATPase
MTPFKRYFNTSGPNIPSRHYTLLRENLVEKGLDLVESDRYFTIWAPRQSGKSTYFFLLKTALEKQGHTVIWMNVENYLGTSLHSFLYDLGLEFEKNGITAPVLHSFSNE